MKFLQKFIMNSISIQRYIKIDSPYTTSNNHHSKRLVINKAGSVR